MEETEHDRIDRLFEQVFGQPWLASVRHGGAYLFGSIAGFGTAYLAFPWEKRLTLYVLSRLNMSLYSAPLAFGFLLSAWMLVLGGAAAIPAVLLGRFLDARVSARARIRMGRCIDLAGLVVFGSVTGVFLSRFIEGTWKLLDAYLAAMSLVSLVFLLEPTGSRLRKLFRIDRSTA
jgi:hypothetical protein